MNSMKSHHKSLLVIILYTCTNVYHVIKTSIYPEYTLHMRFQYWGTIWKRNKVMKTEQKSASLQNDWSHSTE
jgi:hypothetical protein